MTVVTVYYNVQDPGEAILVLDDLTSSGAVTNRAATVYLLGDTLSRTNRTTVGGVQNVTTDPLQESQVISIHIGIGQRMDVDHCCFFLSYRQCHF